jgi:hypothetical protein
MCDVFRHLVVSHLKLKNPSIFGLATLAVYIITLEATRLLANPVSFGDELITRRRQHESMAGCRWSIIDVHECEWKRLQMIMISDKANFRRDFLGYAKC